MKISKRLRVIGDLVQDNSFILDIGCDHALLDIYLVLNKKNIKAIASDINIGPLKVAKDNIKKYKLENKIKIKCSDGLEAYEEGVDTLIFSGLGSSTIVDILNRGRKHLQSVNKIIVSSNNDYYYLRKKICDLGFYIKDETIVLDKGKYYPIVIFEKGNKKYKYFELKYGPILTNKKDEEFISYLNFNKSKLLKINKSLGFKYFLEKIKLKREIRFIDSIVKKYNL